MLPRKNRLSKTRDVQTVLRRGRAFFSPYMTIKFLRKTQEQSRITVIVSTKVHKRAVRRNLIKRIIRESFQSHLLELPIGDWTIHAKNSSAKLQRKELRSMAEDSLLKIIGQNKAAHNQPYPR